MKEHSPAPWKVSLRGHVSINGAAIVAADGLRVVSLPRMADRSYPQKEADAALIAAAPDLLALLIELRDSAFGAAVREDYEDRVDAAISKAEGR